MDCAARSVCGRANDDAVVCDLPHFGSCDTVIGKCTNNAATSCTSFRDCQGSTNARIAKSAQQCVAKGGTVSARTSGCDECGATTTTTMLPTTQCCLPTSPGGAFLTCMVLSPTDCATAGGVDVGPGSCGAPPPCPPSTTVVETTSTTATTATTMTTTSSTTTTTGGSASGAFLETIRERRPIAH